MIRQQSFFNLIKLRSYFYHASQVSFTLFEYLTVFFQSPQRKRGVLVAIIRQRVMEDMCQYLEVTRVRRTQSCGQTRDGRRGR